MSLPFSETAFLDLFGEYNTTFWPAVTLLWVVTAGLVFRWWRLGRLAGRWPWALLAVHWLWSGAYHWFFFRTINPAATFFAVLFVIQAIFFGWLAGTARAHLVIDRSARGVLGVALMSYSLVYPFLGLAFGLHYPRMPLFAVPCPTTLLTAGLLLLSTGTPRVTYVIPIVWAAIASSAALVLGIRADLMLIVAAGLLAIDVLFPQALGTRRTETT